MSCLGRPNIDLNIIRQKVFPLLYSGDAKIWFTKLPYNYIFTWDYLKDVLLARYYLVSKKFSNKDRLNNFVALLEELVSRSWNRFTMYVRGVQNHCMDDESLNENFYWSQDDNNKAILHTIAGGSYGD